MGVNNPQNPSYRQLIYDRDTAEYFKQLTSVVGLPKELNDYMPADHIQVLRETAHRLGLFILVRRTNPRSVKFFGLDGFVAKPVNCKPKTADNNITSIRCPEKKQQIDLYSHCAGLVVDPNKVGSKSFKSISRFNSAIEIWNDFEMGTQFKVQEDINSGFYGCVMRCDSNIDVGKGINKDRDVNSYYPKSHRHINVSNELAQTQTSKKLKGIKNMAKKLPIGCAYIHADYDLYALIHKDNKNIRVPTNGQFLGLEHTYGKYWLQFEACINGQINSDMIQHGSQEHFCDHSDEIVDIFAPFSDRSIWHSKVTNINQMKKLYKDFFNNRKVKR
jgi:hypothetical protein